MGRGSCYYNFFAKKAGKRSGAWRNNARPPKARFRDGEYTPADRNFDAILSGCYESSELKYVANVHGGFVPALRESVFKQFRGLGTKRCPFSNVLESRRGQWGEGLVPRIWENAG